MKTKISVITLGTSNLFRSRQFYEEGLCWPPIKIKESEMVYYQNGTILVALYKISSLIKEIGVSGHPIGFNRTLLSINMHSKNDVDDLLNKAKNAGGRILKPAQKRPWGGYSGFFSDPDENPFEAVWNPKWDFAGGSFK